MAADSVKDETGLSLPSGTRISAAQAQIFSLDDGNNYQWLIESEVSLLPWANETMAPERGGWEHIHKLAELGDFRGKVSPAAEFGGVWRSVATSRDGREETAYLYL